MDLFLPNPQRAIELDESVRRGVGESLAALGVAVAEQVPDAARILGRLVDALAAGPVRPSVFALYGDLVTAIELEDEAGVMTALDCAAGLDPRAQSSLRAVTLTDDDLGPGLPASFLGHVDDDPDVPIDARPLSSEEMVTASQTMEEAFRLIAAADPVLAAEFRGLIREVVLAAHGPDAPEFGGTTSFFLWGSQLLNTRCYADPLSLAEGMVHEAAHSLLFGWSMGEALVENDPNERFLSPMRMDRRPMDGVVHASFVIARLHYLATRPPMADMTTAAQVRDYEERFRSTDEIIEHHARFTPVGEALYRSARQYMMGA